MAYKLNGKFVSKAKYDEAVANGETIVIPNEESPAMSETEFDGTDETTEEPTTDKRRGPRATTLFKKAANKKTAAEVKLLKAKNKLSKFDHGRDELLDAVEDAEAEVEEAQAELQLAADAL